MEDEIYYKLNIGMENKFNVIVGPPATGGGNTIIASTLYYTCTAQPVHVHELRYNSVPSNCRGGGGGGEDVSKTNTSSSCPLLTGLLTLHMVVRSKQDELKYHLCQKLTKK